MIETTILEINVIDLMEQVRVKAAEIQKIKARESNTPAAAQHPELPSPGVVPSPPPLALPQPAPARKERVLAMLGEARAKTEVSSWIPKPVRRFFRKQGGYNRILLDSTAVLTKSNAELAQRLEQLCACVEVQHGWLHLLQKHSEEDSAWMRAAGQRLDAAAGEVHRVREEAREQLDSIQRQIAASFAEFRKEVHHIGEHLRNLQDETTRHSANERVLQKGHDDLLKGFQALRGDGERSAEHVRNLQREVERNAAAGLALQKGHEELSKAFQSLRTDGQRSGEHVRNLQKELERSTASQAALQKNVADLLKGFQLLRTDGERSGAHLINLQKEFERNTASQTALQKNVDELLKGFQLLRTDGERSGAHLTNLQKEVERNAAADLGLRKGHEELSKAFQTLRTDGQRSGEHIRNLQKEHERSTALPLALQKNVDELLKGFQLLRIDGERSGAHLTNVQKELDRKAAADLALQKNVDELSKAFQTLRTDGQRGGEHIRNLQKELERNTAFQAALQKNVDDLLKGFQLLRTDGERSGAHLTNLQKELDRIDTTTGERERIISRLEENLTTEGAFLRAELSNQNSLLQRSVNLGIKTNAAGDITSGKSESDKEPRPVLDTRFDAFYMSFEDRFRGSRNEIKERISFYLPYVWESNAGTAGRPIVDIGCGRGEWLELLGDIGANARGVDINSAMLALCRQRRLDVVQADALEYLRSLPDKSQGAVTGFHIIEHLAFDTLMDVFTEALRVVQPGGFVIFESPNCKNLIVGACNFNIDPTHRNPVYPDTAKFMLDTVGFQRVEIEYLTPIAKTPFDGNGAAQPVLKDLLYGPQDFAVIGYKAPAP